MQIEIKIAYVSVGIWTTRISSEFVTLIVVAKPTIDLYITYIYIYIRFITISRYKNEINGLLPKHNILYTILRTDL